MLRISRTWIQASSLTLLGGTLLSAAAVFTLGEDEGLEVRVTRIPAPAPAAASALGAPAELSAPAPKEHARPAAPRKRSKAKTRPRGKNSAEGLALLLERFDAFEDRLAALERSGVQGEALPVGQLIAAPQHGQTASAPLPAGGLEARFAALEARLAQLDRAKQLRGVEQRLQRLQHRFKKAEAKVKVSQLSVNEQMGLAINTPLGREILAKVDELEQKLDNVLSKRVIPATSYSGLIPGLWGTYYSDRYLTTRVGVQVDPQLNFDWGRDGPEILAGKVDEFSIRWEGVLRISEPGTYSFYTVSDDGIRLWIGEQLVLAEYDDHARKEDLVDIELEAGDYPLRVEYYERGGHAVVKLLWKLGGYDRGAIPPEVLFHSIDQERM